MTEIHDFIEFVEKERRIQETEKKSNTIISIRALEWLGRAIFHLTIIQIHGDSMMLQCDKNNSRFRPGDRLIFSHEERPSFKGILHEVRDDGRLLLIKGTNLPNAQGINGWYATEDIADLSYSIQKALRKIQPGAPGWTYSQRLIGDKEIFFSTSLKNHIELLNELIEETEILLDESQKKSIMKCLTTPPIYGIQGPPGTGKTLVLAFVTEAFLRLGKRAVILAPTHQAVNNALSTVKTLFPKRDVKKYGDELRTESLDERITIITSPLQISKENPETLIGLTFMAAIHQLMISDKKIIAPNVVIIEEAGQLPIAQGICTGLSGAGSVILFGDDKQMPPIFAGDLSEDPLAISIFAQLRLSQQSAIDMLTTTYRLNDELCTSIGEAFYSENPDSYLTPSPEAKNRRFSTKPQNYAEKEIIRSVLSPEHSLIWLKVSSRNCTQLNMNEANIIAEIVHTCLKSNVNREEIAVITPFRRQVMQIRHLVRKKLGENNELPIIDTVERVQGLTVEIAIISMCSSLRDYNESIAEFIFSSNRLNVAASRARTKSIIVSHPNIFECMPKTFIGLESKNICKDFLNSKYCKPYTI